MIEVQIQYKQFHSVDKPTISGKSALPLAVTADLIVSLAGLPVSQRKVLCYSKTAIMKSSVFTEPLTYSSISQE